MGIFFFSVPNTGIMVSSNGTSFSVLSVINNQCTNSVHDRKFILKSYVHKLASQCCNMQAVGARILFFDPHIYNNGQWSVCRQNILPFKNLWTFYNKNNCWNLFFNLVTFFFSVTSTKVKAWATTLNYKSRIYVELLFWYCICIWSKQNFQSRFDMC